MSCIEDVGDAGDVDLGIAGCVVPGGDDDVAAIGPSAIGDQAGAVVRSVGEVVGRVDRGRRSPVEADIHERALGR